MRILHIFSVYMYVPSFLQTSVTKHNFKDKITKNFKMATGEH